MKLYAADEGFLEGYLAKLENATNEDISAAREMFGNEDQASISSVDGGVGTITISGVLTPDGPSPLARFFGFGGTSYNDIIAEAKSLKDDDSIEKVRLIMKTPGGTVEMANEARVAIKDLASKKTVIAENHGQIASAGYLLAGPATKIIAMSPFAITGSIGVVIAGLDVTEAMAREGIKKIKIVSKNAPNKQSDPTTEKGRERLQEEIDAAERVFMAAIAEDRNTTAEHIIENFGKGGMLIAQDPDKEKPDAISVGMIDGIENSSSQSIESTESAIIAKENELRYNLAENETSVESQKTLQQEAANGGNINGEKSMDLNTLKAEHPAIFQEAVNVGASQERERAEAHLTMGEASGDMAFAVVCIKDGSEMSANVNAKYMAASMKKNQVEARGDESEGNLETEAVAANTKDDAVATALAKLTGGEDV